MKRSPLVRRSPLRRAAPFRPGRAIPPSLGSSGLPGETGNSQARSGRRRKSTRKTESDRAWAAIRPALEARADGRCEISGDPLDGGGHAHHRKRRGAPDRDVLSNALLLAPIRHGWVHRVVALSHRFGWIVRTWQNPAEIPCYRRGVWVRLGDDGTITPVEKPTD